MADFVRTSIGFINLDQVMLIRVGVDKEVGEDDFVQFADGRIVNCRIYERVIPLKEPVNLDLPPPVPATPAPDRVEEVRKDLEYLKTKGFFEPSKPQ